MTNTPIPYMSHSQNIGVGSLATGAFGTPTVKAGSVMVGVPVAGITTHASGRVTSGNSSDSPSDASRYARLTPKNVFRRSKAW